MTEPILITSEIINRLTPRQIEIVNLLCEGKTYAEIGHILSITLWAVKAHVHRACWKMNLENRTQLIVVFTRWQTIQEMNNGS